MKSLLLTTSAVLLVAGGSAFAACPEDIETFTSDYEQTLRDAEAGEALSTEEQAQLYGLRVAAENLYAAGKADLCAEVIDRASIILEAAVAPQVVDPDDLVGRSVTNAADEDLGEVERVMLDPASGRIAYVLLEHGGVLGIGENVFAVPWQAMQYLPGQENLILEMPEEKLENAPRFNREDLSPLERRSWVLSVHNYYGVSPYWQNDMQALVLEYGLAGPTAGQAAPTTPETQPSAEAGAAGEQEGQAADRVVLAPVTVQPAAEPQESEPSGASGEQAETDIEAAVLEPSETAQMPAVVTDPSASGTAETGETGAAALAPSGTQQMQATGEGTQDGPTAPQLAKLAERIDQLEAQVVRLADRVEEQEAAAPQREGATPTEEPDQATTTTVITIPATEGDVPAEEDAESTAPADTEGATTGTEDEEAGTTATIVPIPATEGDTPSEQDAATTGTEAQQETASEDTGGTDSVDMAATEPAGAVGADAIACEEQVAELREDLETAEEQGGAVQDVREALEEAEAMLENASLALCRAAVKRARDELAEIGFAELNEE